MRGGITYEISVNFGINLKAKSPLNLDMAKLLYFQLSSRKEISRTSRSFKKEFEKKQREYYLILACLFQKLNKNILIIYLEVEQWKGL